MKVQTKRLSSTDWHLIEKQLRIWFDQRLSRQSFLPFRSAEISSELALTAASLFKRGSLGVKDTDSNSQFSIKARTEPFQTTTFSNFALWSDFFRHFFEKNFKGSKFSLIVDQTVLDLHPVITETCAAHSIPIHSLSCTEENKTLATASHLYDSLSEDTEAIVVVGGGICCDIAGFVGGLLNAKLILVPTTLLALVDAGLGGKTGVNDAHVGKNQIGLFSDIQSVVAVQELLTSLTPTLMNDGLAEIMKHAWLCGKFETWKFAIEKILSLPSQDVFFESDVQLMILENIEFKNKIVEVDRFENNIRVVLNLGHTVAHLLEGLNLDLSKQREPYNSLTHGQAVCYGLWAFISCGLLGEAPAGYKETLERIQNRTDLKIPLFNLDQYRQKATELLLQDKKNAANSSSIQYSHVRCVLPPYGALTQIPEASEIDQFMKDHIKQMPCDVLLNHLCECGLLQ